MKLEKLKKLLIRLCVDGDLSICESCKNNNDGNCKYSRNEKCKDDLAYYIPNEDKF